MALIRKGEKSEKTTAEEVHVEDTKGSVEDATSGFKAPFATSLHNSTVTDMGFDTKANGMSKKVLDVFLEMLKNRNAAQYTMGFDAILYLSNEYDPASGLAFDTIAVVGTQNNVAVAQCFYIVHTRRGDYDTATITTADGTAVTISKYPSDVHDSTFITMMTDALSKRYGYGKDAITILNSKVLYPDFDIEDAEDEFLRAVSNVSNHMLIYVLGVASDISFSSISKEIGGGISVNIRKVGSQESIVDENGMGIAPNLSCAMNCITTANRNDKSMNRLTSNVHIADAYIRTGVVYSGNAAVVSAAFNASGKLPIERSCFTPVLTIEDIRDDTPTLGKHLLMVSGTTALIGNNNIIHNTITPEVLAHLNIRANISDSEVPTPLPIDDVKNMYHIAISDLLSPNIMVGIVVKPGTHGVNYTKHWINEGSMCSTLRTVADELTNGMFSTHMPINMPLTDGHIETRFCGTYVDDNGNDRPLSEIDIVHLMMAMPSQVALHDNWILAQSTQDSAMAIALKKTVLDTFCTRGYEITDIQYVVYILGETLQTLSYCLSSSNINITTNADSIVPNVNTNWAPHIAANAGFSLDNVSMSSLNNGIVGARRVVI